MRIRNLILCLSIGALFLVTPTTTQAALCGDSDANDTLQITDIIIDIEYIFRGGAPPLDFDLADFDGRQQLNIADVQEVWHCFFTCTFANPGGECPPSLPALAPVIDPAIELRYFSVIQAGVTSVDVPLTLAGAPDYTAFAAPLLITINGAPAIIDSVTVPAPGSVFFNTTRSLGFSSIDGPGIVRIGLIDAFSRSSALDVPAIVHLSVPASAEGSRLELNWTTLSPIQAPTADSSLTPLFYTSIGDEGFIPTLLGECCLVPGDANNSGSFNIGDVTFLIARIFRGGPAALCDQAIDTNADGLSNIADVTYGIANIFQGGPSPICGP